MVTHLVLKLGICDLRAGPRHRKQDKIDTGTGPLALWIIDCENINKFKFLQLNIFKSFKKFFKFYETKCLEILID